MGAETYESIQKKLRDIEGEEYLNKKLEKQHQEEEDGWYQDGWYLEQNKGQGLNWIQDAKMQRLIQEQQEDLLKMQKVRARFMEAGMEKLMQRKRGLEGLKEACYLEMRRTREEEIGNGGIRRGEDY